MEDVAGALWSLQVIVGPLVLAIALAFVALRWQRRRRRLQGEGTYTAREVITYAIPLLIAVAVLTYLMLLPGSE